MLIALAARAAADPIAEAVRYANILTGVDPDAEVARGAPDDPDDRRAGTSSDDDDDDDDDDHDRPGTLEHDDDDDGDSDEAEARAERWPADGTAAPDLRGEVARREAREGAPDREGRTDDADRDGRAGDADRDGRAGDADRDGRVDDADRDGRADDADRDAGSEDAGAGLAEHASELALLDDEPAGAAAITSDEAGFLAPAAGAVERYEARMRRRRSWILGRLDVGLAWRRREREPMHAMSYVSHEVWLLATWRR